MPQIFQDTGFRHHFIAYVLVNLLLIAINLYTTPQQLWFFWPLLGWGIGIFAHGFATYRRLNAPAALRGRVPPTNPGGPRQSGH
jgi:hypothetical protein